MAALVAVRTAVEVATATGVILNQVTNSVSQRCCLEPRSFVRSIFHGHAIQKGSSIKIYQARKAIFMLQCE